MLSREMVEQAKQVDLLALVSQDTTLRKVANTHGGEYAGPCPFCGGRDRLRVQPEQHRWWCRQCGGNHWTDAIAYVRKRDGIGFAEARERLTNGIQKRVNDSPTKPEPPKRTTPPSTHWQSRAKEWLAECEHALWSERGAKARAWLINYRGLNKEILHTWHIGDQAVDAWDDPKHWGFENSRRVWLPRGITIPCQVKDTLWSVKIRRPQGDPKYIQPRGSVPGLFGAETLGKHDYAILTEGEFDALLAWQSLQQSANPEWRQVGVATLGSATNSIDIDTWADYLLPVSRFLVCYDADKEGVHGSEKWDALTSRARRVVVPPLKPGDKDLTDFQRSGGNLLDLITFEIERDRWQHEQGICPKAAHLAQTDVEPMVNETAQLRAQRDEVSAEWNRLFDQLETLDQSTPEFESLFTVWEQVDEAYKRLCDQIDCMELTTQVHQQATDSQPRSNEENKMM